MADAPPGAVSSFNLQQATESRLSWLRSEREKLGNAPAEQAALALWRAASDRFGSEIRELLLEQQAQATKQQAQAIEQQAQAIEQQPFVDARLRREENDRLRSEREAKNAANRAPLCLVQRRHLCLGPGRLD